MWAHFNELRSLKYHFNMQSYDLWAQQVKTKWNKRLGFMISPLPLFLLFLHLHKSYHPFKQNSGVFFKASAPKDILCMFSCLTWVLIKQQFHWVTAGLVFNWPVSKSEHSHIQNSGGILIFTFHLTGVCNFILKLFLSSLQITNVMIHTSLKYSGKKSNGICN